MHLIPPLIGYRCSEGPTPEYDEGRGIKFKSLKTIETSRVIWGKCWLRIMVRVSA